jgi:hypothetical protein
MQCPLCIKNPKAHSFVKFAQSDTMGYWYTAPAKAEQFMNTPELFAIFKLHMAHASQISHWVWVLDCSNMTSRHALSFETMKLLIKTVVEEYSNKMSGLWFVNLNPWIRGILKVVLPLFPSKLVSKIEFLEDTDFDLISRLRGARVLLKPW